MSTINSQVNGSVSLSTTGPYASPLDILSTGAVLSNSGPAVLAPSNSVPSGGWSLNNQGGVIDTTDPHGIGVEFQANGNVVNQGQITGGSLGVDIFGGGSPDSVINFGKITGSNSDGIYLQSNNSVVNNSGEINGGNGTAVAFGGSGNIVVYNPGATFNGNVIGGSTGGGNNTLVLASGGSNNLLPGLGTKFTNFTTIQVNSAANWQVSGNDSSQVPALNNQGVITVIGAGLVFGPVSGTIANTSRPGTIDVGNGAAAEFQSTVNATQTLAFTNAAGDVKLDQPSGFQGNITGFQSGDTLDLVGINPNGLNPSYGSRGLSLTNNGATVATLDLSTPYQPSAQNPGSHPAFSLAADGNGGTLITVREENNIFSGKYPNGIILDNPATQNPIQNPAQQSPATITATGSISNTGNGINGKGSFAWAIDNLGTVLGNGNVGIGVSLANGGTITNGQSGTTSALISGYYNGIAISGALGTVVNDGSVLAGTGTGVYLAAGGSVTNYGVIKANIGAYNSGIDMAGPGKVVNGAISDRGALIEGSYSGITFGKSGGTVINYGKIEGSDGTAVYFTGGHNKLVDEPGAHFAGNVSATGTRGNTLELAKGSHSGVIADDLSSQFQNFTTVKVDPGATWKLSDSGYYGTASFTNDGTIVVKGNGSSFDFGAVKADTGHHGAIKVGNNTVEFSAAVRPRETVDFNGSAGTVQMDNPKVFHGTIAGFGNNDTILFGQQQLGQLSYAGGKLTVTAQDGSTIANFSVSGNYSPSEFQLTPDGHGIMFSNSA